jgi:hypothetical protein
LRFFRILPKVLRQLSWVGRKANKTQLSDITAGHSAKIANFFDKQNFVMKSILVELQETQCFFMIACQSVVLLSKNHNGIFSATNMVIVWVDHMIAGLCAAAGILPVVLGLWTLQRSNMCSGWIFFLSTATMITAECALYSVFREPKVSDMTSLRGTFPASCGQHPPPLRYCTLDQIENTIIPVTAFVAVISPFCLSLYGVTAIMFFWPHIEKLLLITADGRPRILQLVTTFKELWSKTWFKVSRGIMTFLIEAAFLLVALIYISCFALMISSADMAIIDWTSWGFGQFIAVTTWASVICKYVYWSICELHRHGDLEKISLQRSCRTSLIIYLVGTESYTETRFGASAHLVQDDKEQSNDDPTNDPRHELKSTEEYISLAEQSKTDLEAGQISKKY